MAERGLAPVERVFLERRNSLEKYVFDCALGLIFRDLKLCKTGLFEFLK